VHYSPLAIEVLHLVVDCHTSLCVWHTLEKAFASPSNSRIMQLHGSFQALWQGDSLESIYIQQAKSLFDELVAAGRPMSLVAMSRSHKLITLALNTTHKII